MLSGDHHSVAPCHGYTIWHVFYNTESLCEGDLCTLIAASVGAPVPGCGMLLGWQ